MKYINPALLTDKPSINPAQALADLIWTIDSPLLVDTVSPPFGQNEPTELWFKSIKAQIHQILPTLHKDPSPLLEWLAKNPYKSLGRYFESLIGFAIRQGNLFEEVHQNLVISDNHKTIGEIDFLLYSKAQDIWTHLEVAVKFYLKKAGGSSIHDFIGPEVRDRLDLKIHSLVEKQLALTDSWRHLLPASLSIDSYSKIEKKSLIKGYIFTPWPSNAKAPQVGTEILPLPLQKNALTGLWIHWSDFKHWGQRRIETAPKKATRANLSNLQTEVINPPLSSRLWVLLEKRHWLSPFESNFCPQNASHEDVLQTIEKTWQSHRPSPLLFAEVKGQYGHFHEITRLFIVPDGWPEAPHT